MSRMRPQRSCRVFWRLNNKFLSLVSRSRYRLVWDRNSKRKNMYRMYLYKYRIYNFYIYWGFFNAVPWNGFAPSHTVFHWQKLDHLIYEAYLINSLQWFIENSMFVYILIWKSHETSKLSSYTYRSITMGPHNSLCSSNFAYTLLKDTLQKREDQNYQSVRFYHLLDVLGLWRWY